MPQEKKNIPAPMWIALGVLFGAILKLFAIDFLRVSGSSMEPFIHDNSIILVNKLAFGFALPGSNALFCQWNEPKKNDVVIYLYDNKIVVKRCVATSGTKLEYLSDRGYRLLVEGTEIPLTETQYNLMRHSTSVPNGYILAIGDNYAYSIDSRTYGFVSVSNILGKILCK